MKVNIFQITSLWHMNLGWLIIEDLKYFLVSGSPIFSFGMGRNRTHTYVIINESIRCTKMKQI